MNTHLLTLLLFVLLTKEVLAQQVMETERPVSEDTLISPDLENKLEFLAESNGNEEEDYSEILSALLHYASHPLAVNTASKEELESLGLLNDFQIRNLIEHIRNNGKFISKYELQTIAGFDRYTIHSLLPFIRFDEQPKSDPFSFPEAIRNIHQTVSLRYGRILESEKGYHQPDTVHPRIPSGSRFAGSPDKILFRYQLNLGNFIQTGITARKDPGEAFFQGPEKQGFDYYSLHLQINNYHCMHKLIAGDYTLGFGQGLLAWTGLAFSRTTDAMQIKKNPGGIQTHSSSSKNGYLRGLAADLKLGPCNLILFASYNKLDASITDTTLNGQPLTFRTLQTSGLHATYSELASKNAIRQQVLGSHLGIEKKQYGVGISYIHTLFNASLEPRPVPYELFSFRGKELHQAAADYHILFRNLLLFGEAACSVNNPQSIRNPGIALVQGLLLSLDEKLSFSSLLRSYSPDYHSFTSNGFSEGGKTQDEQGLYMGLSFKPTAKIEGNASTDYFRYPWLRYRINTPVSGKSTLFQITCHTSKFTQLILRLRQQTKPLDPPALLSKDAINSPLASNQTNIRIQLLSRIQPWLRIQSRMEWIRQTDSAGQPEKGFLLLQEVSLHPPHPYSISVSYSLFETPSGNTKIYAYQHTVPGDYSIPSFSGSGSRAAILIRYSFKHGPEFWASLARTYYDDRLIISPGTPEQISGPHKTEVSVEMKWKFQ
ncbi:MAG TPA: helix-hairpin-helix domain-containing protein [Bacteroidia bacterium]|jgi:hypothetical protein|nr:helix-hairpin-helix domain-containing protein [Bacteroidia bacterium]